MRFSPKSGRPNVLVANPCVFLPFQQAPELCAALQTDQQRSDCKETLPVWAQPLKVGNSGSNEIRIVRQRDGIQILNSSGRPIATLPAGSNGNIRIIAKRTSGDVSAN